MPTRIMLSGERARGLYALVDDDVFERLSQRHWNLHHDGYAVSSGGVYMHREVLGLGAAGLGEARRVVDHIDHDRLNNQRSNLRVATPKQNSGNRLRPAQITLRGTAYRMRVGRKFVQRKSPEAVADARNKIAAEAYGEFATLIPGVDGADVPRVVSQRTSCTTCGVLMGRKSGTPAVVAARKGAPPICKTCHMRRISPLGVSARK